jgi:hypothetical protein
VAVIVLLPDDPCVTVMPPELLNEKSNVVPEGFTVNAYKAVLVKLPLIAFIVKKRVPAGVVDVVVIVRVDVHTVLGVQLVGENAHEAPDGSPLQLNCTEAGFVPVIIDFNAVVVEPPGVTDPVDGVGSTKKSKLLLALPIVNVNDVVFVVAPPVPVTVIVYVPVGLLENVSIDNVIEQLLFGVHDNGVNVAITFFGIPVRARKTGCFVPDR